MPFGAVVGTIASYGVLAFKDYRGELSAEGVDDRAFRIEHNAGQVRVDQASYAGLLGGAAAGAIFGKHGFRTVLSTGFTGVALGVMTVAATNWLEQRRKE